ncbi:MAG: putative lipid II flippase FtsW [Spirochaetaceae bacterium]|jgi:cell division protein FtsW|nr:putative lipid II flippase FtsW [Spirochaetaceae bacterium]
MGFSVDSAGKKAVFDHALIVCIVLLTGAGLATLYSASYAFAENWYKGDRWHFVSRQSIFAVVGFLCFAVTAYINMETLRGLIKFLVIVAIILCCLTFVPGIGLNINGASRWIGWHKISFQPSELVKLILPLYLAHIFDKKKEKLDTFVSGVLPPTLITMLFFTLILLQNNFSIAIFIALNAFFIFFLAGIKKRYFVGATIIFLPISFLLVLTKEHRLRRLISFIWPEWEPMGAGYQVRASVMTVKSGGFWGKGIGLGTRKIESVPEIQSDFIFSAFSEEGGFIGVVIFILVFVFFAWRGYRAALRSGDTFKRLLACGMVNMIVTQALLNIAVVSGAVPATGVPLPFFSAGGSSLLVTLIMSGLIVNVSRVPAYFIPGGKLNNGVYDGV